MTTFHRYWEVCECGARFQTSGRKKLCSECAKLAPKQTRKTEWKQRYCPVCFKPIPRKDYLGIARYNAKKTCGKLECKLARVKALKQGWWTPKSVRNFDEFTVKEVDL